MLVFDILLLVYNRHVYSAALALSNFFKTGREYVVSPACKRVLPREVFIPGMPRRKTLVLHLDDLLIHKDFKIGKGSEIALRPGLRKFLAEISKVYEIVILSDNHTDVLSFNSVCYASSDAA